MTQEITSYFRKKLGDVTVNLTRINYKNGKRNRTVYVYKDSFTPDDYSFLHTFETTVSDSTPYRVQMVHYIATKELLSCTPYSWPVAVLKFHWENGDSWETLEKRIFHPESVPVGACTVNELNDFICSTKCVVSPEMSEMIQEKLFKFGWTWGAGQKGVLYTDKPFLYFHESKYITYGIDFEHFKEKEFKEVRATDILNMTIKPQKFNIKLEINVDDVEAECSYDAECAVMNDVSEALEKLGYKNFTAHSSINKS